MIVAQVYSIREQASKNFYEAMKQLKDMGYEGVELAGLYGHSPAKIHEWLAELKLIPISAHVPYEAFVKDLDGTVKEYATVGCSYIAIPYLPMERLYGGEKYDETVELLRKVAMKCSEKGMILLYHNHSHEFVRANTGDYVLDELFKSLSEIETELDTCWVKVGGENPVTYIMKYKDRCPLVHIKDFQRKEGIELMALGEGEMDIKNTVLTATSCGAHHFVIEQDDHPYGTPMENMAKSIHYLRKCYV